MFKILKEEAYQSTVWAAGCTTELFIYPEDASFSERRFLFRVSKATVEAEESTFTPLPGVTRWIMPLSGPLNLSFANDGQALYTIELATYQSHCFKGEWQTKSKGKVADFNLMLKDHAKGHMREVLVEPGSMDLSNHLAHLMDHQSYAVLLHVVEGAVTIGQETLGSNETAVYIDQYPTTIGNLMDKTAVVILVEVSMAGQ